MGYSFQSSFLPNFLVEIMKITCISGDATEKHFYLFIYFVDRQPWGQYRKTMKGRKHNDDCIIAWDFVCSVAFYKCNYIFYFSHLKLVMARNKQCIHFAFILVENAAQHKVTSNSFLHKPTYHWQTSVPCLWLLKEWMKRGAGKALK